MNIESLAGFINDGGSNRTRTRNTSSNNTCRNGHRYHHLSLYIPGCAEFLSFFIEKIPVSFRISGFSVQSPRGVGVVQTKKLAGTPPKKGEFQSPRGVGVVQTHNEYCRGSIRCERFQSPRGVEVVQTATPRACMVMRQTGIWISKKHLSCFIFATLLTIF